MRNGPEYEVVVVAFHRFTNKELKDGDTGRPFGHFNDILEERLSTGWELDQAVEFSSEHEWASCVVRRLRLLPCPFCGSTRVTMQTTAIKCDDCKALGPRASSLNRFSEIDQAVALWNHRTAPPAGDWRSRRCDACGCRYHVGRCGPCGCDLRPAPDAASPASETLTVWEHKTPMGTWEVCEEPEECTARAKRPVTFDICGACGQAAPPAVPGEPPTAERLCPGSVGLHACRFDANGRCYYCYGYRFAPADPTGAEPPRARDCIHGRWTCEPCFWVGGFPGELIEAGAKVPRGAEPGTGKP